MKVTAIRALNLQNMRAFNEVIAPDARVVLLCGPNGSGKTALIEGVRLALTGQLPRGLQYKNGLSQLIMQGEKDGAVVVEVLDDGTRREYKTNLKTGQGAPANLGYAAIALRPQAFMEELQPHERRKALFNLAGISLKVEDVSKSLIQDGHAPERVKRLERALSQGFDAAQKQAGDYTSEARGAWQAMTGETYGSVKAQTWTAPSPTVETPSSVYSAQVADLLPRLNKAKSALSALEADHRSWSSVESLRPSAEAITSNRQDVETHKARVVELEAEALGLQHARTHQGGWTSPCPACGVLLESSKAGDLHEYTKLAAPPPQAGNLLEQNQRLLTEARTRLTNAEKKLSASVQAREVLAKLPQKPTQQELDAARDEQATAEQLYREATTNFDQARNLETQSAGAAMITADAKRRHEDVAAFGALQAAIVELPGRYLARALERINQRMATLTPALGAAVQLGEDMDLRYGTIPYPLASRSQQWRCALALGMALATDHVGIVLMDEFDLIEPAARGGILKFLGQHVGLQVVLGATLKQAPALPAPAFQVRWLGKES